MKPRLIIQRILALTTFWLLVACASQPALPKLERDVITSHAAETMTGINSLHFAIDLTGKLTYIDPGRVLALKRAEGDIVAPDRMKAVVRTRTFGTTSEINVVGVGMQQWARNPASGRWEALPSEYGAFDIGALFNAENGLASLLRTTALEQQPNESIDNRSHYVLTGSTTGERLAPMTSCMIQRGTADVKLWIDGAKFGLSQIDIVERDTDAKEPTTWRIKLSSFNTPVEITPPAVQ